MFIGLTGKARSGKDTFGEMLAEELFDNIKKRFILMAYAHELKLRVQKAFDLSYDQLWGDLKEVEDERYVKPTGGFWTPREILQSYGEFYRSIDKNFWINHLFRTISEKGYENVILTDIRHPNEADPVIENKGHLIRVVSDRSGKQKIHGEKHISEVSMDSYDINKITYIVDNSGTLDDLRQEVKKVAKVILLAERFKNF